MQEAVRVNSCNALRLDSPSGRVAVDSPGQLTNSLVLEHLSWTTNTQINLQSLILLLSAAVDGKEIDKVNAKAVGTKVKRVRDRRKKLLKDKAEDAISELLCQPFVLPELDIIPAHYVSTESCDIQKENASKFEKNSVESLSKKIIDLEEELARKRETAEICCVFHEPNLTHLRAEPDTSAFSIDSPPLLWLL